MEYFGLLDLKIRVKTCILRLLKVAIYKVGKSNLQNRKSCPVPFPTDLFRSERNCSVTEPKNTEFDHTQKMKVVDLVVSFPTPYHTP